jgi:hypothetical protein
MISPHADAFIMSSCMAVLHIPGSPLAPTIRANFTWRLHESTLLPAFKGANYVNKRRDPQFWSSHVIRTAIPSSDATHQGAPRDGYGKPYTTGDAYPRSTGSHSCSREVWVLRDWYRVPEVFSRVLRRLLTSTVSDEAVASCKGHCITS